MIRKNSCSLQPDVQHHVLGAAFLRITGIEVKPGIDPADGKFPVDGLVFRIISGGDRNHFSQTVLAHRQMAVDGCPVHILIGKQCNVIGIVFYIQGKEPFFHRFPLTVDFLL